ncbi:MAG TPA: DUF4097 family beta strand repeat-containing protein [Pyrinomonadaceae bacterium]|nr:DUF4097 family beta strand repeat-containing protein [Pyrinomonadaceae bacterium]
MKARIFLVVLLVIAAAVAGRWVTRMKGSNVGKQEETRQSVRLEPGARVEVRGINGSVEVNTAETDTADIHILRTSESAGDLEYNKITVEASSTSVVVHGENDGPRGLWHWLWGGGGHVKQEVTLTLPRRVELSSKGVNGPVTVGEVDGPVTVEGVNGRVEVAQSSGHSAIKGVNGNVKLGVTQLGAQGMEIKGVNGNVELRFKENVNADVDAKGNNGGLTLDLPNVTMQERKDRSSLHARLGTGGAPIEIKGVNGNVHFESDAPASASTSAPTAASAQTAASAPAAPSNAGAALPPPPPSR